MAHSRIASAHYEKAIFRIKWISVEEPGVIPKILEEARQIFARFQTEGQPRLESVLDNINATIIESTAVLSTVKKSLTLLNFLKVE